VRVAQIKKKSDTEEIYAKENEARISEFKKLPDTVEVWKGRFQNKRILSNSIDAIITDPPYAAEYLKEWKDLSRIAKRILKPSGFLITYSGTVNLNEVFKILSNNLLFYWQLILLHKGQNQLITARNIFCNYKPILIFQKEPFKKLSNPMDDLIFGTGREKEKHPWQQAEKEMVPIIENFTRPGDLILDPFAGSGTIPVACHDLKRKVLAIDDKKENIKIIYERFGEIKNGKQSQ